MRLRILGLLPRMTSSHMRLEEGIMKATTLPEQPDAKSPAGADIRFIMDGETGNHDPQYCPTASNK